LIPRLIRQGAEVGAFLRSDNIPGEAKSSVGKDEVNASGPNAPDLELLNSESSQFLTILARSLLTVAVPVHYMK
jgi:hypothetical protein